MRVLVVNAGSSSMKLSLVDGPEVVRRWSVDPGAADAELRTLVAGDGVAGPGIDAVGHRVVHGGDRFLGPTVLDAAVEKEIEELGALAPLHQGPALAAIRQLRAALPDVVQVACFDTAFHTTMPAAARTYAVPARWRDELGVRRYGFHGLAHEWSARRAAGLVGRDVSELRIVTAHLGSGSSLCAVDRGRSVDTTMGMTPTAGLVMGSRCGDLDPMVALYLLDHGMTAEQVRSALDRESGLLALAGTADVRTILGAVDGGAVDGGAVDGGAVDGGAADGGAANAVLAVEVWAHRARALVAAMAAAMGGLDVLAFSGGIGENAVLLRSRLVGGLGFLGVAVDEGANAAARGDADIGRPGQAGRTVVVTAREDAIIAEQVRRLLG